MVANFCYKFRRLISYSLGFAGLWMAKSMFRISIGRKVRFIGFPSIDIRNGAQVLISDGVMLNSSNFGYHVGMFGPVKIIADKPDSVIKIGEKSRIHGSCLHATSSIEIGKNCLIAANCQIMDSNGHDLCMDSPEQRIKSSGRSRPIKIEDNVWIGCGVVILPGVTIGEGSVVGANSVVKSDIPPHSVFSGNPAVQIPSSSKQ